MSRRRLYWPLAILPFVIWPGLAGCRDAAAPLNQANVGAPHFSVVGGSTMVLQQSSSAPPLETYQVSFWAYTGKETNVVVNYQRVGDEKVGQPFLRFYIPKIGLVAGGGGVPLNRSHDSVFVTLNIDPTNFRVDFQPSGVQFAPVAPAILTLWYENRNPDLNGDGVVDSTDQTLLEKLAIYYEATSTTKLKIPSKNDTKNQYVLGGLLHFSTYAVSW
ncbi:MAG TPA: hypothetical protein VGU74_14515 [Gemmatimonadales bacterium]|nr:hypothetical protein [Gemmatimonadales bacterium]